MFSKLLKLFRLSGAERMLLIKDILFTKHDENITRFIRLIKKTEGKSPKKGIIIDIGAFDGMTAVHFAKEFPGCSINAFEPNANAFNIAIKNCNNYKNISLNNIAISDKTGEAEFSITENQVSSSLNKVNNEAADNSQKGELSVARKVKVKTQSLDELKVVEEILILKIDVQGHEKEVISGGINTLNNVHFILIEMNNHNIYEGSSKYYEVDQLLRESNFKLADIIVTYRKNGLIVTEYDAIYLNRLKYPDL
jgi:FkbM family methyltransferase